MRLAEFILRNMHAVLARWEVVCEPRLTRPHAGSVRFDAREVAVRGSADDRAESVET